MNGVDGSILQNYGLIGLLLFFMIKEFVSMFRAKVSHTDENIEKLIAILTRHIEAQERISEQLAKNLDKIEGRVTDISVKTDQLYDWHNVNDQDGAKVWYVKKSVEEKLDRIEKKLNKAQKVA